MTDRQDKPYAETHCKATGIEGSINVNPEINCGINIPTISGEEDDLVTLKFDTRINDLCDGDEKELNIDLEDVVIRLMLVTVKNTGGCDIRIDVAKQGVTEEKEKCIESKQTGNFFVTGPFKFDEMTYTCSSKESQECKAEISISVVVEVPK